MKIQHTSILGITPLRKDALAIAESGLSAIDTRRVLRDNVLLGADGELLIAGEKIPLSSTGRLIVSGVGKCAAEAAAELERILGNRIDGGVIVSVQTDVSALSRIKGYTGTHPLPSEANVTGARALLGSLHGLQTEDVVLCIVSGGGSTLLCLPDERNCIEEEMIQKELTDAGATIQELNVVRKHLSLARGGFVAQAAYPARVVSLVFSDVRTDDLQFIASGPTVKDETTTADAEAVLAKHNILRLCGLENCGLVETPKDDRFFKRVTHHVLVSNAIALEAMAAKARELGFSATACSSCLTGEAREVGAMIMKEICSAPPRSALLYGGETTVTLGGSSGRGGRNMELALSALQSATPDTLLLAIASDGRDNSDIAGALADEAARKEAKRLGRSIGAALDGHTSYDFFDATGAALRTGPTGSNVSDLIIALHA